MTHLRSRTAEPLEPPAVQRCRCDLDLVTEERAPPYSLVCTKNQASYDRRTKQRREDLEDLARLG